jgi:ppGpp synthetase/RelA/SpoT-type nucleotidyltranferase
VKIDAAIRAAYSSQAEVAGYLRQEVDRDLRQMKREAWHYESRIKSLESFALKVETGRVDSIAEVEDVFAATLVVPDATQIPAAVEVVDTKYELAYRRPRNRLETAKRPESFPFDDLRLYVRYRRAETELSLVPDGLLFEVQVKTFLQHAWAVATHDVIYKSERRDWRRERVAHQIRAALEQAEMVIDAIEELSSSDVLPQSSSSVATTNQVIDILVAEFDSAALPANTRRLAETVEGLFGRVYGRKVVDIPAELRRLLEAGRSASAGAHNLDWSPYRSILNYLADSEPARLKRHLRDGNRGSRTLVYPEVLEKLDVSAEQVPRAVLTSP